MATLASHNTANASVKRILREARQLQEDPSTEFVAAPLEDNLFDWHCTIRGPKDTEFEGGLYHVRIVLPPTYPFRPPSLRVLTPSGRFETDTPICISFTNYHEELWQPAWGIRTAIIGLQGFFPQSGTHAVGVGALNAPIPERKRLATLSRDWKCPHCKERNIDLLPDPVEKPSEPSASTTTTTTAASDLISQPTVQQQPQSPTVAQSPVLTGQTPTQAPNHIVLPSFAAPNPSTANSDNPGPPRGLPPATSPTRNMPFFELGPNTAETPAPRNGEPTPTHEQQNQENVQLQVHAFPAFRSAAENGVPLWLDSAILILSVLLGGIIAHRVMF